MLASAAMTLLVGLAPADAGAAPLDLELEWLGGAEVGAETTVRNSDPAMYEIIGKGLGPASRLGVELRPFAEASRWRWLSFAGSGWGAAFPSQLIGPDDKPVSPERRRTLWSWGGRLGARARAQPLRWLSVAAELGYTTAGRTLPLPTEASTPADPAFTMSPFAAHGLLVGALLQARFGSVTARLGATVVPYPWGRIARLSTDQTASAGTAPPVAWDATAGVSYELPAMGGWELSLRGEYVLQSLGATLSDAALSGFVSRSSFVGIGIGARPATPTLAQRRSVLRGRVLLPDRRPAVEATVSVDGAAVAVAADGSFEREPPSPRAEPTATGSVAAAPSFELKASLPGFKPLARSLTWAAAALAEPVELVFAPADGPGRIRGTVRARKDGAPVVGAAILGPDGSTVESDTSGAFLIPSAGPGPVPLKVSAKGYKADEPVVSVAPAAEVLVEVILDKADQLPPALLRGLIRSATKRPLAAKVRILNLATPVVVKPDGRFLVEVPPGVWSIVISAPGHVTQTKSVEVSEGDQALFHCDLQPVGR